MNKAYDRVEWDFMVSVMRKLGFCVEWMNVVMRCVSSVQFSMLINGQPAMIFKPTRGLQQGDDLSPYLFLIVNEVLSWLIKRAVYLEFLEGIQLSMNGPKLTHLLLADDSLVFLKANLGNCRNISNLLRAYCHASGQQGPSKRDALAYIKERVLAKVMGWKQQFLSQAGREVLIKAVAQAVPFYLINVFRLPARLCREIDGILAKFWWGNRNKGRSIHWVNWGDMGGAKGDGGMGFWNLMDFNTTLLTK